MIFIIVIAVTFVLSVAAHEAGHLIAAKRRGVKVSAYSIGMGPKLVSFRWHGIDWCLKLLPLGGSCSIDGDDMDSLKPRSKVAIFFAGVAVNFAIALIAIAISLILGGNFSVGAFFAELFDILGLASKAIPEAVSTAVTTTESTINTLETDLSAAAALIPKTRYAQIACLIIADLNIILGGLNILPFPGLDGGQIAFTIPEFFGYKVPERIVRKATKISLFILLGFSLLVMLKDFILL